MKFLGKNVGFPKFNRQPTKILCKSNMDYDRRNIYAFHFINNNGIFVLKCTPRGLFIWEGLNGTETYFHNTFTSFTDAIEYVVDQKHEKAFRFTNQSDFIIWAASIVVNYSVKK